MKRFKGVLAIGLLPAASNAQSVVTLSIPTCLPGAGMTAFPAGALGDGGASGSGAETLVIALTETNSLGSTTVESFTEVTTSGVTSVPSDVSDVVTPQGTYTDVGNVPLPSGGKSPLNGAVTSSSEMSVEYCAAFCGGSPFFAVYNGDTCNCGTEANLSLKRKDLLAKRASCTPCKGNGAECCGYPGEATVYSKTGRSPFAEPVTSVTKITTTNSLGSTHIVSSTGIFTPTQSTDSTGHSSVSKTSSATHSTTLAGSGGPIGSSTVPVATSPVSVGSSVGSAIQGPSSSVRASTPNSAGIGVPTSTRVTAITAGGTTASTGGVSYAASGTSSAKSSTGATLGGGTSTSTSAAPVATYKGSSPACPAQNNSYFMTVYSNTYDITCGLQVVGQIVDEVFHADSYIDCLTACDLLDQCVAVTYANASSPSGTNCNAYYNFTGYTNQFNEMLAGLNVDGPNQGSVTSPDDLCAQNSTSYDTIYGDRYNLYCGYTGGSSPLVSVDTTNFEACIDYCGICENCTAVTYTGPHTPGVKSANCNTFAANGTLAVQATTDFATFVPGPI